MSATEIAVKGDLPATNLFSVLERAATDPNTDVEKMERLYDMIERNQDSMAVKAYSADMVAAQAKMPKIIADSRNNQTNSNYAKLDTIIQVASPIWAEQGFALSFGEGKADLEGFTRVTLDVIHRDGHSKSYHRDMPLDIAGIKGNTNKTPMHASGSTVSYGRRYLTCMVFNIATGDDNDGNLQQQYGLQQPEPPNELVEQIKATKTVNELGALWKGLDPAERKLATRVTNEQKAFLEEVANG